MNPVAALLLAVAAGGASEPAAAPPATREGPVLATGQASATILRPAVLQQGRLVSAERADAPRSQRTRRGERVTYELE